MRFLKRMGAYFSEPLSFEPSARQRLWLVTIAVALYLAPVMWQAARTPRMGDVDMIRVGLVVYNRFERSLFAGDIAMQAGDWWPGYTPVYIGLLGLGYRMTHNLDHVMFALTGVATISLLLGFYALGRKLGLPFVIALALALMSGLYVTTALGTSWTGIRLEMAAARNLYLALVPWIMWLALHVYRRPGSQTRNWFFMGLGLGLLANLHSISGLFLICVLGGLMVTGVAVRRFRLRDLLAYGVAVIPGVAGIYAETYLFYYTNYYANGAPADLSDALVGYRYTDLTKANLFFYRLPNWPIPIALYGLVTMFTAIGLWRSGQRLGWWVAFGVTQFAGAALLLPVDWLVLLAGIQWVRRRWRGRTMAADNPALMTLAAIGMLALVGGSLLSAFAVSSGFSPANFLSRGFQRGGSLSYGVIIVFAAIALWDMLRVERGRSKRLLTASVVAAFTLGFHQQASAPVLEAIPYSENLRMWGQLLPTDVWTYGGVLLLLAWSWLETRGVWLRFGWAGMLIFLAVTRLLAAPASDLATLLVGATLSLAHFFRASQPQWRVRLVGMTGLVMVAILPISGQSVVGGLAQDSWRVFLRDWSPRDRQSKYAALFEVGEWIRQNTPPGSVVISNSTFLRYWMLRPMIIGDLDAPFLAHDAEQYAQVQSEFERLQAAYPFPDALLAFSRAHDADYIVVPGNIVDLSARTGVRQVYVDDNYAVYALER